MNKENHKLLNIIFTYNKKIFWKNFKKNLKNTEKKYLNRVFKINIGLVLIIIEVVFNKFDFLKQFFRKILLKIVLKKVVINKFKKL